MSEGGTAGRREGGTGRPAALPPLAVLAAASLLGCARIEPPPGGPPDPAPPQLVATFPESLAVRPGFDGEVEFRFDEVISEGSQPSMGTGTGDLEKLVVLSPSDEVPDVNWRRNRIGVRPAEGWRADRVYRVELLPGVSDLRRNRSSAAAVVTFTTGAPLPTDTLRGIVYDWTTARPARQAAVEAVLLPDSLSYRTQTDSGGRYVLGPVPAGEYLVYGAIDQNRNLRRDSREAFDSARIAASAGAVPALWTFTHDTVPPRAQTVAVLDSTGATVTLSQMLDPAQRFDSAMATVRRLPDSIPVPVAALLTKPAADSLARRRQAPDSAAVDTVAADSLPADTAQADTARADRARADRTRADSAAARPAAPGDSPRPQLNDRLVLRVAQPWTPATSYLIEIRGVRGVSGVAGDVQGVLAVPEPRPARDTAVPDSVPPDSAARDRAGPAAADSAAPRADSARADSLRRAWIREDSIRAARRVPGGDAPDGTGPAPAPPRRAPDPAARPREPAGVPG